MPSKKASRTREFAPVAKSSRCSKNLGSMLKLLGIVSGKLKVLMAVARPPGGPPPGGPPPGGGTQQASADQLKQLSSTLEQYDLNNLSEDDQTSINKKLTELGFSASKSKVSFTV